MTNARTFRVGDRVRAVYESWIGPEVVRTGLPRAVEVIGVVTFIDSDKPGMYVVEDWATYQHGVHDYEMEPLP